MKCYFVCALMLTVPSLLLAENIFKINITPEEARSYLNSLGSDVNKIDFAPKTGENELPEKYNDAGQFVYMGRVIENPSDYVEEHYDAHQYHGQDGTGQYVYGYRDWNQGKNEKKDEQGTVSGSYKYVQPTGRDFIAKYYADETGFHVEDNRPAYLKAPATKTPAVLKAEEEHFRLWSELAAAAGKNPDPFAPEYQQNNQDSSSSLSSASSLSSESSSKTSSGEYVPGPDEKGEPYGFFYAFDYSVPLLRNKKEREELEQLRTENNHDE